MVRALEEASALDLQILGRTLFHAALVGLAAGLLGGAFFATLEWVQSHLLERFAGYSALKAHGEAGGEGVVLVAEPRLWALILLPAVGGLLTGLLTRLVPETAGGGGDAMIEAFHNDRGRVRRRVLWVKFLASLATLGTGGSGGREGPTMQIGASLGSTAARWLKVSAREHRTLMIAGVAAGMAAVFRTPLGAALLAVEVLYRDDFEAEALIPAVLSAVIAYAVVIYMFGESVLFRVNGRFDLMAPRDLALFAGLGLTIAVVANVFVAMMGRMHRMFERLPIAPWARPAAGGLALGLLYVALADGAAPLLGLPRQTFSILGGGYGAVQQMVLTPGDFMPVGWAAARLLLLFTGAKLLATALTIGSGGSAGDFAPSLVLGGAFGGAYGVLARLMLGPSSPDPAAFALVGMGAFYGGIAHVPLSALVFVCELAGSYDLLVPLMLAEAIAFVALRNRSLYHSQPGTRRDSPVHRSEREIEEVGLRRVSTLLDSSRRFETTTPSARLSEFATLAASNPEQESFPVVDGERLVGIVSLESASRENAATVAEVMRAPVSVDGDASLRTALRALNKAALHSIPVVDAAGHVTGLLHESDLAQAYVDAIARIEESEED